MQAPDCHATQARFVAGRCARRQRGRLSGPTRRACSPFPRSRLFCYGTEDANVFQPRQASHGRGVLPQGATARQSGRLRGTRRDAALQKVTGAAEQADAPTKLSPAPFRGRRCPAHARAGQVGRGHRFAAYRCLADLT